MKRKKIRVRIKKEGGTASSKYMQLWASDQKGFQNNAGIIFSCGERFHFAHDTPHFFQFKSSQRQTKSIGKIFEIFGSFQITLSFN